MCALIAYDEAVDRGFRIARVDVCASTQSSTDSPNLCGSGLWRSSRPKLYTRRLKTGCSCGAGGEGGASGLTQSNSMRAKVCAASMASISSC